ncbi:MAG: hypothetical protein KJZ78_05690 [Bryobacteraceae bacterium]|nr:hypothetical protein [Bryobacteraceae bacterium]
MDLNYLQPLQNQHAYAEWKGKNTLGEDLFVWRLIATGIELEGWQAESMRRLESSGILTERAAEADTLEAPGAGSATLWTWVRPRDGGVSALQVQRVPTAGRSSGPGPKAALQTTSPPYLALTETLWHPSAGPNSALMSVWIYECSSRTAAHQLLLQSLAQFQLPGMVRTEETAVGDVAFALPSGALMLFARGNLVVLVRNAGRQVVPVMEHARRLDEQLISKPEAVKAEAAPQPRKVMFAPVEARVKTPVPVLLAATEQDLLQLHTPTERLVMYKVFARGGELSETNGQLVYTPAAKGQQEVNVFTIDEDRVATRQRLRLTVK